MAAKTPKAPKKTAKAPSLSPYDVTKSVIIGIRKDAPDMDNDLLVSLAKKIVARLSISNGWPVSPDNAEMAGKAMIACLSGKSSEAFFDEFNAEDPDFFHNQVVQIYGLADDLRSRNVYASNALMELLMK